MSLKLQFFRRFEFRFVFFRPDDDFELAMRLSQSFAESQAGRFQPAPSSSSFGIRFNFIFNLTFDLRKRLSQHAENIVF